MKECTEMLLATLSLDTSTHYNRRFNRQRRRWSLHLHKRKEGDRMRPLFAAALLFLLIGVVSTFFDFKGWYAFVAFGLFFGAIDIIHSKEENKEA